MQIKKIKIILTIGLIFLFIPLISTKAELVNMYSLNFGNITSKTNYILEYGSADNNYIYTFNTSMYQYSATPLIEQYLLMDYLYDSVVKFKQIIAQIVMNCTEIEYSKIDFYTFFMVGANMILDKTEIMFYYDDGYFVYIKNYWQAVVAGTTGDVNETTIELPSGSVNLYINQRLNGNNFIQTDICLDTVIDGMINILDTFDFTVSGFAGFLQPNTYPIIKVRYVMDNTVVKSSVGQIRILYQSDTREVASSYLNQIYYSIVSFIPPSVVEEELPYWTYTSFGIETDFEEDMIFTNFDLTYNMIKQSQIPSKFYYNPSTIDPESWGSWTGFKWLRNGLCAVINTLIVVLSFLMYILTVAFNYLIMWIGTIIIIFIWNILIYYIFYAICFIVDFLWGMLVWLWDGLKTLVDAIYNALTIAVDYLIEVMLPAIADFIIIAFSYITAILLWILTLGRVPFAQLLEDATLLNGAIADGLFNLFTSIFEFLPYFFMYIVFYLDLLLMLYLKKFYCQAKSYTNRVAELELTLSAFMEPIRLSREIIDFVKGCIPIIF